MAKPTFQNAGTAAAWGDLSGLSEPMLGNLFAVSIKLPPALAVLYKGAGTTLSMLASGVTIPEENLELVEVVTKLSTYDVVVGKTRGELSLVFKEQTGAPVTRLLSAWNKACVDARGAGIGFPADYRAEVWVAPLSGDGVPYFWWGHKGAFPKSAGQPTFGNDQKTPIELTVPFSYVELVPIEEATNEQGANAVVNLGNASDKIGI